MHEIIRISQKQQIKQDVICYERAFKTSKL